METGTLGGIWLSIIVFLLIVLASAFGVAGGLLMQPIDRYGEGFALGFFLGPVGLVIAWTIRANELLERQQREQRRAAAPPAPAARAPQPSPPPMPQLPREPRRYK